MEAKEKLEGDALLEAARRGDPRAREPLTERLRFVARVLAAMNARMGSPLNADDLADLSQDTVVILLRKLDDLTSPESLEGWIYRVCSLELMNCLRRQRRQPKPVGDALEAVVSAERAVEQPMPGRYEDIYLGLERIEVAEAFVIRMKFFEEKTFDEIAASSGLSLGTVKTRFYRGIVKLQAFLKNRYPEAQHVSGS